MTQQRNAPPAATGEARKDSKRRLTDILTASELTINNVMVAWSFNDPGAIEVGPHPDYSMWSNRYDMTDGACCSAYKESSLEEKLEWLLSIYYAATEGAGVDVTFAHREFQKIPEWREAHPTPPPTDPVSREARRVARCQNDMDFLFGGQREADQYREVFGDDDDDGPVTFQDLWKKPLQPEGPGARFVIRSFEDITPDLDNEDNA
jgi:hypothetical protein